MSGSLFRDPQFDALRNALYHTERRTFLDFINRSLNFVVIILGAAVAGKAAKLIHVEENWLELAVVVFATIQLVFDLGSRARLHEYLQKRYYELLSEMEGQDLHDSKIRTKWSAKLLAISGDEPMPMRALDSIAYNKALSATCDDETMIRQNRMHISWWQRRMRHIFAFHSAEFPTEDVVARRRKNRFPCIRHFFCKKND